MRKGREKKEMGEEGWVRKKIKNSKRKMKTEKVKIEAVAYRR
jgi:hypothetical protein